jgi:hypothetical protein
MAAPFNQRRGRSTCGTFGSATVCLAKTSVKEATPTDVFARHKGISVVGNVLWFVLAGWWLARAPDPRGALVPDDHRHPTLRRQRRRRRRAKYCHNGGMAFAHHHGGASRHACVPARGPRSALWTPSWNGRFPGENG